jgi:hypothetical protein
MTKSKIILLLIVACFLSGCSSYTIGSLMHPQIKTIAIGKIKNVTDQPRLSLFMKEKLKERFMQDASVKVVRLDQNPDIILTGKVVKYRASFSGTVSQDEEDEENGLFARISSVTITFQYDVKTKKDWDVVSGTVSESSEFTEVIDQLEEKRNALRRAAYEVSKEVVVQITEAW